MNDRDYLARRFEENRTHLRAVAYRMLGSLSEVDDAVQEAWLRLSRADTEIAMKPGQVSQTAVLVGMALARGLDARTGGGLVGTGDEAND